MSPRRAPSCSEPSTTCASRGMQRRPRTGQEQLPRVAIPACASRRMPSGLRGRRLRSEQRPRADRADGAHGASVMPSTPCSTRSSTSRRWMPAPCGWSVSFRPRAAVHRLSATFRGGGRQAASLLGAGQGSTLVACHRSDPCSWSGASAPCSPTRQVHADGWSASDGAGARRPVAVRGAGHGLRHP